jgi:hypothetical protein
MLHLLHLLTGPFNFLVRTPEEIRRVVPDFEKSLPQPQKIFLEDEESTPLAGFPILASRELTSLEQSLEQYVAQEEEVELAVQQRAAFDSSAFQGAWESYRLLLVRAMENVTTASYGRHFPTIFWLWHSFAMARTFKETPKRLLRRDLTFGREHGDELKYRVYHKVMDRVMGLTYDLVQRLSSDTEEIEEQIFPSLVSRMRDNVLIFTEEHVSPNLAELGSYFSGCLHLDGRDFRTRLLKVVEWYAQELRGDPELASVASLLGIDRLEDPRLHLNRAGFMTFLSSRPHFDPDALLSPEQVQVWESLLVKLKEFELMGALRRAMVLVERRGEVLLGRERAGLRGAASAEARRISPSTRPLDFMAPWVVDPLVSRFGLIYDISEFTETVTRLRRSGTLEQDRSFRMMFRFQRKVNRIASQNRAKLEKYLGDGAFYSSREARHLLVLALQIQRAYREALTKGFPFSKGLRIALNHGQYRLLPIQIGAQSESERYEFFGHGVVELTRLTTGKGTREIEEIKNLLITQGYPESTVNRFFAPMTRQNLDVVDKGEETRGFYAYINHNGSLVNEGIVATWDFVSRLSAEGDFRRVFRLADGPRTYIAVKLEGAGSSLLIGIRKLGVAQLKGLDRLPVYEIVDAAIWGDNTLMELRASNLVELVEREFSAGLRGA